MKICITDTELWCVQEFFLQFSKGYNSETKKGEQSFLCGTLCLDLIYIYIKYHSDFLKIVSRQKDGRTDSTIFFSTWAYKSGFQDTVQSFYSNPSYNRDLNTRLP